MSENSLGQQIRAARAAKKMTQIQIADALGVSVQAVSQWEKGRTVPTSMNLIDLAKLLDMEIQPLRMSDLIVDRPPWRKEQPVSAPLVPWSHPEQWEKMDRSGSSWEEPELADPDEYFDVHWTPRGDVYALRIKGIANAPVFRERDIIIIDTGRAPEKGDFVVAIRDRWDAAVMGVYIPTDVGLQNRWFRLDWAGSEAGWVPAVFSDEDPGRVIGTVREHRRFFRMD